MRNSLYGSPEDCSGGNDALQYDVNPLHDCTVTGTSYAFCSGGYRFDTIPFSFISSVSFLALSFRLIGQQC